MIILWQHIQLDYDFTIDDQPYQLNLLTNQAGDDLI